MIGSSCILFGISGDLLTHIPSEIEVCRSQVDLFVLSHTKTLTASYYSTFSSIYILSDDYPFITSKFRFVYCFKLSIDFCMGKQHVMCSHENSRIAFFRLWPSWTMEGFFLNIPVFVSHPSIELKNLQFADSR